MKRFFLKGNDNKINKQKICFLGMYSYWNANFKFFAFSESIFQIQAFINHHQFKNTTK